jgi:hypothetical protein
MSDSHKLLRVNQLASVANAGNSATDHSLADHAVEQASSRRHGSRCTMLHVLRLLPAQVNRELPPGLALEEDAEWIVDDKKDKDG